MDKADPPISWLFAGAERRQRAVGYWLIDPLVGFYNTALHYGMRLLPIDACSNLGAFLSFYSPTIFRDSDARARKVWIRLRPAESDPASVDAAMRRLWRCISRTMAEYSILDRLWDAGRIEVSGIEHLDRARDEGRPILITPMHLGNWEVPLICLVRSGHRGSGIYMPPENRFEHPLVIKSRQRYGARLYAASRNSTRDALRELKSRAEPFVIYVDEFIRGRVQAPAFGRPQRAEGNIAYAARLAAMTNAVIIPTYCVRVGDSARFRVRFLPPVDLAKTGDRDADVIENARRINAIIEPIVRDNLDQWYFGLDLEFT